MDCMQLGSGCWEISQKTVFNGTFGLRVKGPISKPALLRAASEVAIAMLTYLGRAGTATLEPKRLRTQCWAGARLRVKAMCCARIWAETNQL